MTDQERDELLLELRARLDRIEGKVDAVDDRVSEVVRAVREQLVWCPGNPVTPNRTAAALVPTARRYAQNWPQR